MTCGPQSTDYTSWTREQLIERLLILEGPRSVNSPSPSPSTPISTTKSGPIQHESPSLLSVNHPSTKQFHLENHPKRKMALKFSYAGWEYSGLAYQPRKTPLPTVEGVLFDAMAKARLVDPNKGLEGCGWEKCGRTDKGVSAAGQVVSLWVRSAIGRVEREDGRVEKEDQDTTRLHPEENGAADGFLENSGLPTLGEDDFGTLDLSDDSKPNSPSPNSSTKPKNELDYITILNRLLPPTIRILAWTPVSSTFSARFSCKYRHYKYFFSSHYLNISTMREAASLLVGEHDFRNLCKVDAQKQITRFKRVISRAYIEPVDSGGAVGEERTESMFVFNLVGSAFLYHQVRHIMAVLFMIGTGLEKPSLITQLLNVKGHPSEGEHMEIIDRKPDYQMADALPLMLWDCGYADEDVQWRTDTLESLPSINSNDSRTDIRRGGLGTETDLYHQLHSIWNRSRIYTVLDRHFLQAAEQYHRPPESILPLLPMSSKSHSEMIQDIGGPVNYPLGGGTYKRALNYVPVLNRNRSDTVEVINERWRLGKGMRKAERRGENGNEDDGDE